VQIVIYEDEIEKNLEDLRGKLKAKKEAEFNEFLAKINSEKSKVVFSTLYIPESLYKSNERDNHLSQIAGRINKNEIPAGDYKIVRKKLVNILTGEEVENGYALYDKNGNYIASIWENVVKESKTRAKEIVGKFAENNTITEVEVTLSNPIKILPLSLSLGAETKTLKEVVNNLESLGYIVHPNLLISDSGDVALLFFNSQDSYDNFLEATKNLNSYEEYKQWLETGNETKNKHGVGFIFFRERSPKSKLRPDSSFTLADDIASYMIDTLRLNTAKDIDRKTPEEKKQYIRDMREFFSLSRFLKYSFVRDKDNNITDVEFELNWYGHLFLKLLSEEKYGNKKPSDFYKVYLPDHIELPENIVEKDKDGKKYIKVPYYSKANNLNNSNDFVLDMMVKIKSYIDVVKEIIKGNIKSKENKELNSEGKEAMIKSIMNSAVVTKSFIDAILEVDDNDTLGIVGYMIEKANLQYNAVRGDTFFHNKKISKVGDFFETKVMMPMPYLSAEINIKETSGNTTAATPEQEKNDCTSNIGGEGFTFGITYES
jgi:hypothetical protein